MDALVERLDDDTRPVDILHFDGHGVFEQISEKEAEDKPGLFGKSILSEIQRERQSRKDETGGKSVGIGFLLFEKEDRTKHLISAEDFGGNLFRSKVGLVVLSACQTASLDNEGDPMASVAGKLTGTGIPAILAMTHSVLVATTRTLFGEFYASLARGRSVATALDDARIHLANNPEKYEVRRGDKRQMLKLKDWFVPTLFHGGADSALLTAWPADSATTVPVTKSNLREPHETGFFGRRKELWDIAYWFAGADTRRISITGFGGQGKTELAPDKAAEYRRLAREAKRNFAGTAHEMKRFASIAAAVVGAVGGNEKARAGAKQIVEQARQAGGEGAEFAKLIERILAGEGLVRHQPQARAR